MKYLIISFLVVIHVYKSQSVMVRVAEIEEKTSTGGEWFESLGSHWVERIHGHMEVTNL